MKVLELLSDLKELLSNEDCLAYLEKNHLVHSKVHPTDGRIILDYDHIEAVKDDDIARECRGLIIDSNFKLVGRSFKRFFNAGEHIKDDKSFSWDMPVFMADKEDGSMIILSFYKGEWKATTRFSFADHTIDGTDMTWTELFHKAFHKDILPLLDTSLTYVFELCAIENRIVRYYETPTVYLLTTFSGERELTWYATKSLADTLRIKYPDCRRVESIEEALAYLDEKVAGDSTFEGVVLRDCFDRRLKVKSPVYLRLHKKIGNRKLDDSDHLVIYLDGAGSEFLQHFPDIAPAVAAVGLRYQAFRSYCNGLFQAAHASSVTQKDYALKVKHLPYAAILFQMRKGREFDEIIASDIDRYGVHVSSF